MTHPHTPRHTALARIPFGRLVAISAPLALGLLAACSSEPAAQPTEEPVAVEPIVTEPTLPAPDEALFAEVFAAACPTAETVAISSCRSMGMGEADFSCKYGLGEDDNLRHDATLTPGEGEWILADPETTCAQ